MAWFVYSCFNIFLLKAKLKNWILIIWLSQLNIQSSPNEDKRERRNHRALVRDMEYLCNRKDTAGQTVAQWALTPSLIRSRCVLGRSLCPFWRLLLKTAGQIFHDSQEKKWKRMSDGKTHRAKGICLKYEHRELCQFKQEAERER